MNTLATCVTHEDCFFARGVDDHSIRELAESHRRDTRHEVVVDVLP